MNQNNTERTGTAKRQGRPRAARRWLAGGLIAGLAGIGAGSGAPGPAPLTPDPSPPPAGDSEAPGAAPYRCPAWFRDAKFGIEARWSAQSVPEQGDGYAQAIYDDDEPDHRYHVRQYGHPSQAGFMEVIHRWQAQQWQPARLISLYQRAGARYFVALANDYDNFDCFASRYQPWNSVNLGPKKDIVGLWAREARRAGLRFGVSVHAARAWSWFTAAQGADDEGPLKGVPYDGRLAKADGQGKWWEGYDPQDLYAQNHPRGTRPDAAYAAKFFQRTRDLIDQYHPELLAFDDRGLPLPEGGQEPGAHGPRGRDARGGPQLVAHYTQSDRRRHGGRLEAVTSVQGLAEARRRGLVWNIERGVPDRIEPWPWQVETSLGQWAYRRRLFEQHRYKTPATVIHMLADVASKNGNLLLNLPLRGDGTLDADETAFLAALARWMKVNQEAIFGTRPWKVYGEGPAAAAPGPAFTSFNERVARPLTAQDIRFTMKGKTLYAIACGWPASGTLTLRSLAGPAPLGAGPVTAVHLLGYPGSLRWTQNDHGLTIRLPVRKPGDYAFAFKIAGGANFRSHAEGVGDFVPEGRPIHSAAGIKTGRPLLVGSGLAGESAPE